MFSSGSDEKDTSILRCLPEDVLVEIVKQLDTKDALNIRLVAKFLGKSKKINNHIWQRLMQDEFGLPIELIAISEDKRLLYVRLKYIFWRKNCACTECAYGPLAAELMTSIVDGKAKPHDLGWLLYTINDLSQSYIDYLDKLSPDEKFAMLRKAILARNQAVVDQLFTFPDLVLTDNKLQQLGLYAAESGDVNLVKKMMTLSRQHDYELDPQKMPNNLLNMYDAALLSGSVELVQYLHEFGKGGPTFKWGVGSLAVLDYCHEHYGKNLSVDQGCCCLITGSVELAKAVMERCGKGLLEHDRLNLYTCLSGNLKLINYLNSLKPGSINDFKSVAQSGNAQTCLELLRDLSNVDIRGSEGTFGLMYFGAIEHGQYHLISRLEDYYEKIIYPALQAEITASSVSIPADMLELIKYPLNCITGYYMFRLLEMMTNVNGDHFSEELCLRILRAVPQEDECEPWLIQRIAISLGSEKVVDYCLERWPKAFAGNVFDAFRYANNPKFSLVQYLIDVKGIKPDEVVIGQLKEKFGDEALQYFSRAAVHKPG